MHDAAPYGVVVNPSSALGRGARVARAVLAAFRAAGRPAIEISGADAADCGARVRDACRSGLRGLVLVGGDGLIGTVLQIEEARRLPIGVVPAGSGNDFARQFDLPRRPRRAVERILTSEHAPISVDLGTVARPGHELHWFAGGLSIGFDAAINRRANAIRLPLGPVRYHLALLIELVTLRSRRFTVAVAGAGGGAVATDRAGAGGEHSFMGLLATVMNTRTIGGGIPLAPRASVHDGALNLVEVTHGTGLRVFSVLGLLARGRHEDLPEVTITPVTRVIVSAGAEIAFADGDYVGAGPFDVRVAPGALRLLA